MTLKIKVGDEVIRVANVMVIGRDAGLDLILNDPSVSRRHARIYRDSSRYFLEDLGSVAGTKRNEEAINCPVALEQGDILSFAGISCEVISAPKPRAFSNPEERPSNDPNEQNEFHDAGDEGTKTYAKKKIVPATRSEANLGRRIVRGIALIFAVALIGSAIFLSSYEPDRISEGGISMKDVREITKTYLDELPAISVEGMDAKQMETLARQSFQSAESKYKVIAIRIGNAFEAYVRYRDAKHIWSNLSSRPDYYDRLQLNMDESRRRIEEMVLDSMQAGWVARKKGDWEKAYKEYERVVAAIPRDDFPLADIARGYLREIAPKLEKR
ncbi:MAG: FHA domain-containing protein [Deltaproteobacteria bacterium]|nr:FHA domain-containing protein [Deltaproteobacteria bacterium]